MKKNKIFRITLAIIYFGCILFLCLSPVSFFGKIPRQLPNNLPVDKIVHFLMFLPYPFVLWGLLHFKARKTKTVFIFIIITGILFAILTELAQKYLTSYRAGDLFDLFADILGLTTGIIILLICKNKSKLI